MGDHVAKNQRFFIPLFFFPNYMFYEQGLF